MSTPIVRRQTIIASNTCNLGQQRARMRPQPPEGMALLPSSIVADKMDHFIWSGGGRIWGTALPSFKMAKATYGRWYPVVAMPEKTKEGWFWVYTIKWDGGL